MRAVVQRVSQARVEVAGEVVGSIEGGLMVLLAVAPTDTEQDAATLAVKLAGLRVFRDEQEKLNLSVVDVGGEALVISQFTLYGNVRKGRRPSFVGAAPPEIAQPLVEAMVAGLEAAGVPTATGRFGADMAVSLTNDGPVTILLEVEDGKVL